MRFRKLRIAWSLGWGAMALYLVVLTAQCMTPKPLSKNVPSVMFGKPPLDVWITYEQGLLEVSSQVAADGSVRWAFDIPIWQPILPAAVLAAFSWLPIRFSLRTLLIATTLVAAVLGVIVWI